MFRYQIAIYSFLVGLLVYACTARGVYKTFEDSSSTVIDTNNSQTEPKECPICYDPFADKAQEVCVDGIHDFHKTCMRRAMRAEYDRSKPATNGPEPEIVYIATTEIEFHCPTCRGKITNQPLCKQVKQEILLLEGEKYIQDGYDPNATWDENKHTLLHLLAMKDQVAIVEKLIAAGAKLDAVNSQKWTPLHAAADVDATDVMALLLARGADKDAPNDWNWTPLHLTVQSNRIEAMRLLITQGANIEAEANVGFEMQNGRLTPLHLAAYFGQKEAMEVLLESKANVNAKAIYGFTPLHIAALGSNKAFLKNINSDIGDGMDVAQAKYQACIDVLLKASADPTLQNEYGQTYQALQELKEFDPAFISFFE